MPSSMAGRTAQAVIDVAEEDYSGNLADMPYVVNKEASQQTMGIRGAATARP